MGTKFNVTLRPPTGPGKREYVDEHDLEVSKKDDAGLEKITFAAINHCFVVVIPKAKELFSDPEENLEPTLHFRVTTATAYVTPTIKDNVEVGNYEYHVFCEEERDWAHKPGSSPPKIIIVD